VAETVYQGKEIQAEQEFGKDMGKLEVVAVAVPVAQGLKAMAMPVATAAEE
jgi:hypothetical protein